MPDIATPPLTRVSGPLTTPMNRPGSTGAQADTCRQCGVRHLSLFAALDDAALQSLHYRIEDARFRAGQTLYEADTLGRTIFSIRAGVVMLERLTPQAERRILRLAGQGDVVGLEALLGQTHSSRAIALSDVAACALPTAQVQELSLSNRAFTQHLMVRWQRALDEADEWLAELSIGPARERVLRLILKFTDYFGGSRIQLPMREDIGAMLGMTLETASRVISNLRREGLLTAHGHTEVTVDVPRVLEALRSPD